MEMISRITNIYHIKDFKNQERRGGERKDERDYRAYQIDGIVGESGGT